MTETSTPARTPLTSTTWADVAQVTATGRPLTWMDEADLAHELVALNPAMAGGASLDVDTARLLVDAAGCGLPVVMTWETPLNTGRIETLTRTVIVTALYAPQQVNVVRFRVRYWGFCHDLHLGRVLAITTPADEISYRDA